MRDNPIRALRRFCLECQGGHAPSVISCLDTACPFHPFRLPFPEVPPSAAGTAAPKNGASLDESLAGSVPAARVIRRFCMGCAGGGKDVRECDAKENCAVWSYRFGVSPATFKRVVARRNKWRKELRLLSD